jgi:hypothetical protein
MGDIHWAIAKIFNLKQKLGREILLSVASKNELRRAEEFVQLLSPNVRWAGYDDSVTSFEVMQNCLGDDWADCNGKYDYLCGKPWKINLSCNLWLERSKKLSDWLPKLPLDWHYPINIPQEHYHEADSIMQRLGPNTFFCFVSNKEKDRQVRPGWNIWNTDEWVEFLTGVHNIPECRNYSFLFSGASWDYDRTKDVYEIMKSRGCKTEMVVGKHLGITLACLKRCKFSFQFPGGVGLLANNLNVPTIFLLPRILKSMQDNIADPMDMAYDNFKTMVRPTVSEALTWFIREGYPANFG